MYHKAIITILFAFISIPMFAQLKGYADTYIGGIILYGPDDVAPGKDYLCYNTILSATYYKTFGHFDAGIGYTHNGQYLNDSETISARWCYSYTMRASVRKSFFKHKWLFVDANYYLGYYNNHNYIENQSSSVINTFGANIGVALLINNIFKKIDKNQRFAITYQIGYNYAPGVKGFLRNPQVNNGTGGIGLRYNFYSKKAQ